MPTYIKGKLSRIIVKAAAVHQRQDVCHGFRLQNPLAGDGAGPVVGQSGCKDAVALAIHFEGRKLE